jgi:MurNAc alpha-1-phosphate uridylyltransferase
MQHIDYGLSVFRRELFDRTPTVFDLAMLFHDLSLQGELAALEVQERFYEIGSPQGLHDLEDYLRKSRKDLQKAV